MIVCDMVDRSLCWNCLILIVFCFWFLMNDDLGCWWIYDCDGRENWFVKGYFGFICLRTSKRLSVGKFDKCIIIYIFRVNFHAFELCLFSLSSILVLKLFICWVSGLDFLGWWKEVRLGWFQEVLMKKSFTRDSYTAVSVAVCETWEENSRAWPCNSKEEAVLSYWNIVHARMVPEYGRATFWQFFWNSLA